MSRAKTRRVIGIALAVIASSAVLGYVAVRLAVAGRQRPFAEACAALAVGTPWAEADAAFARVGVRSSGTTWYEADPRPRSHTFFVRSGAARWQQCTVEVDPATRAVTRTRYEAGSDFTSCADRRAYPRRFWLCAIADAVTP
ncbi:MAG: hypothetical protein KF729_31550 [Sandaracinaceae bacterium]|nr:hypothetical protein [Sandaracinaceae bacterium]